MCLKFGILFLAVIFIQCDVINTNNLEEKISRVNAFANKFNDVFQYAMKMEIEKSFYFDAMRNLIKKKMDILENRFFQYINNTIEDGRKAGNIHNVLVDSVYCSMFAETFDDSELARLTNERTDKVVTDKSMRKALHEKTEQMYNKIVTVMKETSKMFVTEPIDYTEEIPSDDQLKTRNEKTNKLMMDFNKFMSDIGNEMLEILQTKGVSENKAKQIVSNIIFKEM